MPSVIFHVSGKKFQLETVLAKLSFKPYQIHHVGDLVRRKGGDFKRKDSGFSVDLGPKRSENLARQIRVADFFLKKHYSEIRQLKGADDLRLDFGYCPRLDKKGKPFAIQCDYLSPQFLKMCGELNVGIELSRYWLSKPWSYYVGKIKS